MSKIETRIAEINPYHFRNGMHPRKRLNILLPSINPEHVFGGIATALKFFDAAAECGGFDKRIILVDAEPSMEAKKNYKRVYRFVQCKEECDDRNQIISYVHRDPYGILVSPNDFFIETGWWTAYCLQEALNVFSVSEGEYKHPIIYLIQDFEPGFYPWSSKYMLADSTYRDGHKQIAVFNSCQLMDFFKVRKYVFEKEYCFDPVFNSGLRQYIAKKKRKEQAIKKKQILIYGRPGTPRNAMEIIVEALKIWVRKQSDIQSWSILSAGESFEEIDLGKKMFLKSLGKLTIDQYAKLLDESYVGISLMVSPHPSYPPLEMATFGVRTLTNQFENKDLSGFSPFITSVQVRPQAIAKKLEEICCAYKPVVDEIPINMTYYENRDVFPFMPELVNLLEEKSW